MLRQKWKRALVFVGKVLSIFWVSSLLSVAFAQEGNAPESRENVKDMLTDVWHKGTWDLYLSGYAYHGRDTYSDKKIHKLNEKAWGGGFGKTLRNGKGNDDSLYAMVIKDSNRHAQWMAGYAHQWMYPIANHSSWELGGGYTALLMKRVDWCDGWPFPAVLPVVSLGTRNAKVYATYVPRISTKKGKGDVVLFFAKVQF